MLPEITTEFVFHLMLVFSRLGSAFSIFPAFSDGAILVRVRLVFAILVCLVLLPILSPFLPQYTDNPSMIAGLIATEIMIGILISIAAKLYFWSLHIVGQIISMQSGLGAATFFDPTQGMQNAIFTSYLFIFTVVFIFVSDTHYLFIGGVIDSYERFPPGEMPEIADISKFITYALNDSFILAFKLSAPFLLVSIAILVGSGILARLMPNLQVFFVITPAQILVIFGILYIVANAVVSKTVETIGISVNVGIVK